MRKKSWLVVIVFLVLGCAESKTPKQQSQPLKFTIFATREGHVGDTTANGHIIQNQDRFVALPSGKVLCSKEGHEYEVRITYKDKSVVAPIWDVGPWNTKDNYWDSVSKREMWKDLPQGMPEAQAAFQNNYNNGKDQFGRKVTNPAGIDLADGTFWDDLGMVNNDWVRVEFLWTGAKQPPKPAKEKILFVEDFWTVCTINSDGSEKTEIFPEILSKYKGDHSLYQLAVSSDGTKIAFPIYGKLVNRFEESIAILETDTKKQRKIILSPPLSSLDSRTRMRARLSERRMDIKHLRWSPDRTRIVFEGVRGGSTSLYVLKLNRDVASLVRLKPVFPYFPSWSPDRNKIIFESYGYALEEDPRHSKICLVNADKSSEAQVIAESYMRPEFSPDGKKIAFLDSKWQLCIGSFESDRITDIKILVPGIEVKGMKWSPEGERITFIATDRLKIYIVNIDGNGLKEIFKNRIPIRELTGWVPNFPLR